MTVWIDEDLRREMDKVDILSALVYALIGKYAVYCDVIESIESHGIIVNGTESGNGIVVRYLAHIPEDTEKDTINFSAAIEGMKKGKKMHRVGSEKDEYYFIDSSGFIRSRREYDILEKGDGAFNIDDFNAKWTEWKGED